MKDRAALVDAATGANILAVPVWRAGKALPGVWKGFKDGSDAGRAWRSDSALSDRLYV